MADKLKINLDSEKFEKAAQALFENSKRDSETFIKEQVRGFARLVIDFTPPSRGSVRGTAAKKSGEGAITRDVRDVFQPARPKQVEVSSIAEMRSIMKSSRRSRGGKIRFVRHPQVKVSRQMLAAFIKRKKSAVGRLASGWLGAAKSLGKVSVAAWISRHNAPGKTSIRKTSAEITAEISNEVGYASDVRGHDRRVRAALNAQAGRMERRLAHFIEKVAGKAGFR